MKCGKPTKSGKPCAMPRHKGHQGCAAHDPKLRKRHVAYSRKGGTNRRKKPLVLPPGTIGEPKTIPEVVAEVGKLFRRVLEGELDPRLADTAGRLADVIRRALQDTPDDADGKAKRPITIIIGGTPSERRSDDAGNASDD